MITRKSGKYLEFEFEDGKVVKYDLSTGDSIGTKGGIVKSVAHKMKGLSITEVINSIPDENYRKFLFYIQELVSDRQISNFGTFLKMCAKFSYLEQYFSSGVRVKTDVPCFNQCPAGLIKLARKYDFAIEYNVYQKYLKYTDAFNVAFSLMDKYNSLDTHMVKNVLIDYHFSILLDDFHYPVKPLMLYIDKIVTYEGVNLNSILNTLCDTVRMSSYISPKYDRYPRNLLTTHQIVNRNYSRMKEVFDEREFAKAYNSGMEFKYKEFVFILPKKTSDIKDEAVQQNNCVASYISRVISGRCHIVFMRHYSSPDESYITLEVVNGRVVQAKRAYNQEPSPYECRIIKAYNQYLSKKYLSDIETATAS